MADPQAIFADIVGAAHVVTDPDSLAAAGSDIFFEAVPPCAVVAPGSVAELSRVVTAAAAAGCCVVARGGGLSYSAGYLTGERATVLIDTARLNRIVAIDAEDMWVKVEAGVTWEALNDALAPRGLRTPFWGTGSGRHATVGGTVANNGANYGSGRYGMVADCVLSMTVVLADGTVLTTGAGGAARAPSPFVRHYGPDLTGLFIGDCGAYGIKAEIVLQLMPRPAGVGYAAFSYATADGFFDALSALARAGLHAECFGFDPAYMSRRTTHAGLGEDVKTLASVAAGQGSLMRGVAEAFKLAAAGRRFLKDTGYSLHIIVDGAEQADADRDTERVKAICAGAGGSAIPASIPPVVRANPFPPPTLMVGAGGERWIPVHGIVPHSRAKAAMAAIDAFMNERAAVIARHGLQWCFVALPVGRSAVLIEPTIYWRDAPTPMQHGYLTPAQIAPALRHAADPAARAAVAELRRGIAEVFAGFGAVAFQIGRLYPFLATRAEPARGLIRDLKELLDPARRLNPGVLGL